MYAKGRGVKKDQAMARKWYRKAAEQNDKKAQYNLGVMCFNGIGGKKDLQEAKKWLKKSYENGYKEAGRVWKKYEMWKY